MLLLPCGRIPGEDFLGKIKLCRWERKEVTSLRIWEVQKIMR
jgi:hypothetical protein